MNRVYQVIWNRSKGVWQAASELSHSTRSSSSSGGRVATSLKSISAGTLLLITLPLHASDLPSGGTVVGGQGNIQSSGKTLTVNQGSQNMAINWQDFSIAEGHTVNFNQPNAQAAALNRVTGNQVSDIRGALNANGRVFLVNPNGVMFSSTARVNVGSLVTSTLDISTEDFMAGNYRFEGASANAIINQGNITSAEGGVVAMIAAKIINTGSITTPKGSTLMGAGSRVTLDLGGPVKIEVEEALLDTYIEQGGAIRADGGLVYLTAKAAGELASSVINHTGITEARTLATGEDGRIMLMGDMDSGQVQVAGTLDASAPDGGDGGFIETSAANVEIADGAVVTTKAIAGQTGEWLIDPVDITIASSGGNVTGTAIASALKLNNVTLDTTGTGSCSNVSCSYTGTDGNIFVKDNIQVISGGTDTTLTLKAYRNIIIDPTVTISSTSGKLNTVFWARAGATTDSQVGSVWLQEGSSVSTNGGDITIGGGTNPMAEYALGDSGSGGSAENNAIYRGAAINGDLSAEGGNISIRGKGNTTGSARGVSIAGDISTTGAGDISIYGHADLYSDAVAIGDSASAINDKDGHVSTDTGTIYIQGQKASGKSINVNNGSSISSNGKVVLRGLGGEISSGGSDYVKADQLLIIDASQVTLNSTQTDLNTLAFVSIGNGGLSVTDKDDLTIGTVSWSSIDYQGIQATGTINVSTLSGNLLINENLSTDSISSSAIVLNAGKNTGAGTATGGDIQVSGASISSGSGGRALLYTGSLSGSTGLTGLIGSGSGRFRYNSDESSQGYTAALGASGLYALYREQPTISVGAQDEVITYGDSLPAYSTVQSGYVNGDTDGLTNGTSSWTTAAGTTSTSGHRFVGNYDVQYNGGLTSALGYDFIDNTASTGELIVEKRALSLTAGSLTANDKVYDGTVEVNVNTGTASFSGSISGDDLTVASATGAFADKNAGTDKSVTITGLSLGGTDAGNYTLANTTASTTASIGQKAITVSGITAADKTYDATTTATVDATGATGWIKGDDIQVSASGSFTDKHAGTDKTVTLTTQYTGNDVDNYVITDQAATAASIDPRKVLVSANSQMKTGGQVDPNLTYRTSCGDFSGECGLVNGDQLTGMLSRQPGETVGHYTINRGTLANSDYAITFAPAYLEITPANNPELHSTVQSVQQAASMQNGSTIGANSSAPSTGNVSLSGGQQAGGIEVVEVDSNRSQTVISSESSQGIGPLKMFVIDGGISLADDS